jgi:hypothetical protein
LILRIVKKIIEKTHIGALTWKLGICDFNEDC